MTFVELVCVLALSAVAALAVMSYSVSWIDREAAHSAVYQIQAQMQAARMEAVSRADECRFVIDAGTRTLFVTDRVGAVLHREQLAGAVAFADPDGGDSITLNLVSGQTYDATFTSAGIVTSGAGSIVVEGGGDYRRITLLVGGGVQLEHRVGHAWVGGP